MFPYQRNTGTRLNLAPGAAPHHVSAASTQAKGPWLVAANPCHRAVTCVPHNRPDSAFQATRMTAPVVLRRTAPTVVLDTRFFAA
ncbi:protein of unknown function [Cupriavidus neocaledonicus]|uniref:Uncharacterized protein n=1 Tax=Cupriavidus neocaledonicus TaxID=1040979 RepID=A0A375H5G0_9BURK|nr:exported hypothetical protein [Cupriavidus neocaledonicus]SPD46475.1 protein of unknown function [Cupriavidus neocaledonicus]